MKKEWKVTNSEPAVYGSARAHGWSFSVQRVGMGPSEFVEFFFGTEDHAIAARRAIVSVVDLATDIQPHG